MSRMDWSKHKFAGRETEPVIQPKKKPAPGGWTHIKRQPCRSLTKSEIEAYLKGRPDLR